MKNPDRNDNGKHIARIKLFFACVVIGISLFLIAAELLLPDEREMYRSECRVFEAEWSRVLETGEEIPIDYPGKVPAERGEQVRIITDLPEVITEGEALCFSPIWQNVRIYVDGELRVDYDTAASRWFGKNSPQRNLFVHLNQSDAGKSLELVCSSDSKYAGNLQPVYIGHTLSIWMHIIRESGIHTLVALLMAFLSLFCILISLALKCVYGKMLPLSYLAWTIFLCALWVLSEIDVRQLLLPNISAFTNLTYWCLMLMPLPLILYMNEIQNQRYRKLYLVPLIYSSTVFVIGTVLQVLDIVQFVEQLLYVHIGIGLAILCVMITIPLDVLFKKRHDYLPVAIGAMGLLVAAVIEIALYYINIGLTLGTFLLIGLMFLLIMAIIKTGQDLLRSERNKQQAIAARESQARFLANMSHEIRTPINAVVGMNEMILRENNVETIHEYANYVQSASSMLLGLVNDILDFSKIESGQLELVEDCYNVAGLIQTEILLLEARANDKALAIKVDVDQDIPSKLFGDELRIKQIVTNVLSNAVKYTNDGSVAFHVTYEPVDEAKVLLQFTITDTGAGIREEDLSKLFDSFKRLEQSKNRNIEGAGLGLNIAKQLVELMQGSIEVESVYGKGSTFRISIPQVVAENRPMGMLADALSQEQSKRRPKQKRFTAPEAKILAVDDNYMNLSVIKGLLRRTAVQLDLVTSGQECLELTEKVKYDIIFMDHMMPDMDGVDTLRCIRSGSDNLNRDTLVIALTANAVAGCREMYLDYGFNEYVSKPIEGEALEAILAHMLPEELVIYEEPEKIEASTEIQNGEEQMGETEEKRIGQDALLEIDKRIGLSYVMDSDDLYKEVLQAFCEQIEEYLPQLRSCFNGSNWSAYAVIAHAIKGNAKTIGAIEFSEFSKKQEFAAKEENEEILKADFEYYMDSLLQLVEKIRKML